MGEIMSCDTCRFAVKLRTRYKNPCNAHMVRADPNSIPTYCQLYEPRPEVEKPCDAGVQIWRIKEVPKP